MRRTGFALVMVLVWLAVGCSTPPAKAPPSVDMSQYRHDGKFFPPFDQEIGQVDQAKLQQVKDRAWSDALTSCMRGKGFDSFQAPPKGISSGAPGPDIPVGQSESEPSFDPPGRGWGIVDGTVMSYTGSTLPGNTEPVSPSVSPQGSDSVGTTVVPSTPQPSFSNAEVEAISGECGEQARNAADRIVASKAWADASKDISTLYDDSRNDPRWRVIDEEWAECMRTAGVDDVPDSPDDVTKHISGELESIGRGVVLEQRKPTADEVAAAEKLAQEEQVRWEKDRACRTQVRLLVRRNDLVAAHQVDWITAHRQTVDKIKAEVAEFNRTGVPQPPG